MNYNKNKANTPKRPSEVYPELVKKLARVSLLSYQLYEELKPEEMGKVIGIKKQNMQKHMDRIK